MTTVEKVKAAIAEKFAPAIDFRAPYAKVMLDAAARASLEAVRSPSEAMSDAGHDAVYSCYSLEPGEGFDEHPGNAAWQAMLDAALAEKP